MNPVNPPYRVNAMTPNQISEHLRAVGPHVWYRGSQPFPPQYRVNQDAQNTPPPIEGYLHLFLISERPYKDGPLRGMKIAMCAFHSPADDGDIPTSPEEIQSIIPEGIERYNGAILEGGTKYGNTFYGGYDLLARAEDAS